MTTATTKSNAKEKPKVAFWSQIQSLLNTINHIFILLIGVYVTLLARSLDFQDTAMHMFMTVIGFHVLSAEALMSHYPLNPITNSFTHRNKSRFHGILQLIGGSMALLGGLGKMQSTEVHFTTWHGRFGLFATFMCFASMLGGILNYFQPKFVHKIYSPSEIKFRHNLFGLLTFSLGMTTITLGYFTKFFTKYVDADVIPAFALATILVYLLTMIAPVRSLLDKLKYRKKK
ncbi:LOW QUALITY PROTEIN: cytochrome b561 domain-containing protein 2 [Lucilia sericata]|uniref:LOW QUALITY PROTEIN: cytochrome b561 domain-containing protein 2 n=1 Tax=Lucilia sericata TaxID=13632 RepID=UPI0018A7ECBB|nr:LOW QUALITY PROTEIN: cytochrome b561 domain-containing protein 2 [Lucilia sericata]